MALGSLAPNQSSLLARSVRVLCAWRRSATERIRKVISKLNNKTLWKSANTVVQVHNDFYIFELYYYQLIKTRTPTAQLCLRLFISSCAFSKTLKFSPFSFWRWGRALFITKTKKIVKQNWMLEFAALTVVWGESKKKKE